MKKLLCGLVIALVPAAAQDVAPVALFTQFEQAPPETVVTALRAELDAIMNPIGYRFEWRSLAGASGREVFQELVVVSFKGSCSITELAKARPEAGALGWTHTSGGELLPFTDVHCERIQRILRGALLSADPSAREEMLGRAVGRVLAHELYHIFGKTKRHGSCGVAKAAFSVYELTAENFRFEEKELKVLRDHAATLNPVAEVIPASQ